jgi:translation initiation factor 2 beta subunit (eIF-2beta)/eIF-5
MKAEFCLKPERTLRRYMKNETKCMICESTVFRLDRVTPELILLKCENCGEPHMIGINSDETGVRLTFWCPETGVDD